MLPYSEDQDLGMYRTLPQTSASGRPTSSASTATLAEMGSYSIP